MYHSGKNPALPDFYFDCAFGAIDPKVYLSKRLLPTGRKLARVAGLMVGCHAERDRIKNRKLLLRSHCSLFAVRFWMP